MKNSEQALMNKLRTFPLTEGVNPTPIPYLTIYRFTSKKAVMPQTDSFYLYVVAGGSIRLYTPSGIMDYGAGQYSASQIDTPSDGYVLAFSESGDFLALTVEFTLNDVIPVVLELEGDLAEQIMESKIAENEMDTADKNVIWSICRLLSIAEDPVQLSFMAKHLRREIIFHILCGRCGRKFLQSIINIQQAGEIYEVNSWIKKNFRTPFTVEELAKQKKISVSMFHQKFKSAVGMGPLQCQKRLRLTEARRLMLDENKNVTEASVEVGYESVSQFTRDYRKMFGAAPREDIQSLRGRLLKEQANFP